ncbi:hypothetical protein LSTR_LSTR016793 [Laodelphax striatellus]|uniref:Uncharacterized protein n=1 Tax=Laodelphax striatellus TaxID=195883 RepID=A0A482X504_LAOST|nr:hypothetical protein LSTR_LSTR016793 [Laodelphax striatellus]
MQEDLGPGEVFLREQLQEGQFSGEQLQEEPFPQFQGKPSLADRFQEEPFLEKQFQRGLFPGEQFRQEPFLGEQLQREQFQEEPFQREQFPEEQFLADQAPGEQMSFLGDQVPVGFNQDYNTPDKFRHGFETRDSQPPSRNSPLYDLGYQMSLNDQDPLIDLEPRGYTEGGMVYLPNGKWWNSQVTDGAAKNEEEAEEEALSQILSDLDPAMGWGFKRRERLDVKKPGPFFSTNNYAFKVEEAEEEALSQILSDLDPAMGWGFKRRERLDVKKPGPFFSTNNYAFKVGRIEVKIIIF